MRLSLSLCVRVCLCLCVSGRRCEAVALRCVAALGERGRAVGSLQGRREVLAAVAVGTAGSEGTIEAEAAERQSERGREREEPIIER